MSASTLPCVRGIICNIKSTKTEAKAHILAIECQVNGLEKGFVSVDKEDDDDKRWKRNEHLFERDFDWLIDFYSKKRVKQFLIFWWVKLRNRGGVFNTYLVLLCPHYQVSLSWKVFFSLSGWSSFYG